MLSASAFAFAGVDLRTSAQRPKKAVKILPLATPLAFQVAGATVAEAEPMPEPLSQWYKEPLVVQVAHDSSAPMVACVIHVDSNA